MPQAEFAPYGEALTALARRMESDYGVRMAYHHHMGTVVETESEVDWLMAATGEEVGLLVDSGHLIFADGDPVAVIRRHAARVRYLHCKDLRAEPLAAARARDDSFMRAVLDGVFTTPGDGFIDFDSFVAAAAAIGYRGWLVVEAEQDPGQISGARILASRRRMLARVLRPRRNRNRRRRRIRIRIQNHRKRKMKMFIDREWRDAKAGVIEVRSPYDGEIVGEVPRADAADVERALVAACRGAEEMRKTPAHARAAMLRRAADLFDARAETLAQTLVAEVGKPIKEARGESARLGEMLRLAAFEGAQTRGETLPLDALANPPGEGKIGFTLGRALRRRRRHHAVQLSATARDAQKSRPLWRSATR